MKKAVSAIALLIGGIYLIARGVIRIRIPVAYIATGAVLTLGFSRAQSQLGLTAGEIGVVGDQIYTDVVGGQGIVHIQDEAPEAIGIQKGLVNAGHVPEHQIRHKNRQYNR